MTTEELLKLCDEIIEDAKRDHMDYHNPRVYDADHEQLARALRARLTESAPGVEGRGDVAEAFERTIVAPLRGRYDEKQRTADFAMFSLGYHAAPPTDALAPQSGKKEDGWIDVKERLPEEKDVDVIVHWKDGLIAVQRDYQVKDDKFDLTHWMPLPSPPASKAEGE